MLLTLSVYLLRILLDFFKECWGVFNKPYETLRKITVRRSILSIFFFAFFSWIYLVFGTAVRFGIHGDPIFLTYSTGKLFYAIVTSYFVVASSMYFAGRLVDGKGSALSIFSSWSFSYLPTIFWFFLTTVLYILLPPPRTESLPGQIFSIFYLFISFGLLMWKIIIYFLTLRFSLKLNLWQIIRVSIILWPFYLFYFLLLNRMGTFRVPFA